MEKQEQKKREKPKKIVFNVIDDYFDEKGLINNEGKLLIELAKQKGIEMRIIPNQTFYNIYFQNKDMFFTEGEVNIFVIGDQEKIEGDKSDFRDVMKERYNFIIFPYSQVTQVKPDTAYDRTEAYLNKLEKCYAFQTAKGLINENYGINNPKIKEKKTGKEKNKEKLENLIVIGKDINDLENYSS